ncbi:hypothetical protein [Umezawaea tangerina]|uniref:Small CPxCG-related zinc finger protein n=1 Tax=Umezawaea tangerina TaxID=84725 RepID=A0A2T0S6V4_9PSEU|nr:hypothetical protein [Umezawaea tangerina]PRY29148.1 hypothetical protein CLV43_12621 [Umezawaea tangerina]
MTDTCSRCGTPRASITDPAQRLAWVSQTDNGTRTWLCPTCARAHVRDMESKLPIDYW